MLREHPEFRFAYSQPGFLTFKKIEGIVPWDFVLRSVFARAYGVSLGALPKLSDLPLASDLEPAEPLAEWDFTPLQKWVGAFDGGEKQAGRLRIHLWEKELFAPSEAPLGFDPKPRLLKVLAQIQRRHPELFLRYFGKSPDEFPLQEAAQANDVVVDMILLGSDQLWWGTHLHSASHSPWPGGNAPVSLPPESPSRAYLKCEETVDWAGNPLKSADTALEIGSAPGGTSFALLKRGLRVIGIDPAQMDESVLQHPQFLHIQKPVASVMRESLPESIQWIFLDMNVEPRITLFAVDRLASRMKDSLLGVFLTIKLNRWEIAEEIPAFMEHVRAMGMVRVKAAQLSHHRQEIAMVGFTRLGESRVLRGGMIRRRASRG